MSETDKMMNSRRDHSRIRADAVDDCSRKRVVTLRNKINSLKTLVIISTQVIPLNSRTGGKLWLFVIVSYFLKF